MPDRSDVARAGKQLAGTVLDLEVRTPDATLPLNVRFDRFRLAPDGLVELWLTALTPRAGVPAVSFPCRPADPALALCTPEQRWGRLVGWVERGHTLLVTQPDGARPCPSCDREAVGPHCGCCGERLRVSAPTPRSCGDGHSPSGSGRYCTRCGGLRPLGSARQGRFGRLA